MRIETLNSLTLEELGMLLVILNSPQPLPLLEISPSIALTFRDDALTFRVSQWQDKVKDEYKPIYDQLTYKLSNVQPTKSDNVASNDTLNPPASGPGSEVPALNNSGSGSASS